ncbi:MAG: DNA polymerase III subunit delta' [Pseudomonadota bacterium]
MGEDAIPEADRIEDHPHPRETLRIFGQQQAEARFLDAWRGGRLHHAWLLRGPEGIGKATLAYRIARALIAQPAEGGLFGGPDPQDFSLSVPQDCPVQTRIEAQAEPRLFVLRRQWDPDRKRLQTQISVDHVRTMRRFLSLSAADGGWRAVIVDPADEMNRASANALLKFLEEPPAQTIFLLIAHAPARLLPTIRSRCRTLDLAPLSAQDLGHALHAAGAEVPHGSEQALAELSGGSAGRALRLVAEDGLAVYGRLVQIMGAGQSVDRQGMMTLAEHCGGRDAAPRYRMVLDLLTLLLSRLARAAATGQSPPEAAKGEAALISAAAQMPAQAPLWAETLAAITQTTRHAVAVNLDAQQCVIDTMLKIDATLRRARALAA